MIPLTRGPNSSSADLLSVLSTSSVEYLRKIICQGNLFSTGLDNVKRHIVHTDPHLDEYFAEFLFRSAFPMEKGIDFMEESLFFRYE